MTKTLDNNLSNWPGARLPQYQEIIGKSVVIEPLSVGHADGLCRAFADVDNESDLLYMPYAGFSNLAECTDWIAEYAAQSDPMFFCIIDKCSRQAVGTASYLHINPSYGSIEIGFIRYSPFLKRSTLATEAMYLFMRHAFSLGYRRYEWRCNALNMTSRRAAQRLGFSFEGITRQHRIVKGRNRDTASYAIIDAEWPILRSLLEKWLSESNFSASGEQIASLSHLTRGVLHRLDSAV